MIALLLEIFIIYCCFCFGIFAVKFLKKDKFSLYNGTFLYPVIGAGIIIAFAQILNLVMPIKMIVIIFIPLLVYVALLTSKDILKLFSYKDYTKFWVILCLGIVVLNVPLIFKGELASFQNSNNDIIYYLSSMDWLKDHAWLEKITYSYNQPYYIIGEYVLRNSRYGLDVFGSLFMTSLQLEPHQIFSSLGTVAGFLLASSFIYTSQSVFKVSSKVCCLGVIILACGGQISHLLASQYVPQIMGIAFLVAFVGRLQLIYKGRERGDICLFAVVLASTLAVYAEFALYLLVIYVLYAFVYFIYYKTKRITTYGLISAIRGGFLSIAVNPVAYIAGIHLNLRILALADDSLSNIDAYAGKMKDIWGIFLQLLGWPSVYNLDKIYLNEIIYKVIIVIVILSVIFGCVYCFIRNRFSVEQYVLLGIFLFALIYEISFRIISYGYGEYKHLITFGPILLLCCICLLKDIDKLNKIVWRFSIGICLVSACFNLMFIYTEYLPKYLFYYDDDLLAIQDGVNLVPTNKKIGILNTDASFQHGSVYALKNQNVVLTGSGRSYFSLYMDTPATMEEYMLVPYSSNNIFNQDIFDVDTDTLWHNSRFAVIKNNDELFLYTESGFDNLEEGSDGRLFRWATESSAYVAINNLNSSVDRTIRLKFYAGDSPEGSKNLIVKQGSDVIAEGKTGKYITTEEITIPKGTIAYVEFKTKEPLTEISTDTRTFSFSLSDVSIIEK